MASPASISAVIPSSLTTVNLKSVDNYPGRLLRIIIPGEKLPSVYADIRGKSVMDWIEKHTAGATFCRRSQEVKEVKGGEYGGGKLIE